MTIRLNGSTSGYTEIDAPAVAGNNTITFPTTSGTAVVNGANSAIVSETAKAWNWNGLTTNTSIDFTGIPIWVKRVTVMFSGVSLSGSSNILVQIGASGAIESTSYTSGSARIAASGATSYTSATSGFLVAAGPSSENPSGSMSLLTIGSNLWVANHTLNNPSAVCVIAGAGTKTLSGTLDRVRITTVNGTDTFDAGSINILYE